MRKKNLLMTQPTLIPSLIGMRILSIGLVLKAISLLNSSDELTSKYDAEVELSHLYSELLPFGSWTVGDDEEFLSRLNDLVFSEDEDPMLPVEDLVVDKSRPNSIIHELDTLMSELQTLMDEQGAAMDSIPDLDVDALIVDTENSYRQFVDNDPLRGSCGFDLRPHPFRPDCWCYHCSRYRSGFDEDELHDSSFCPCVECSIVREKAKGADTVRAGKKAEEARRTELKPRKRTTETLEGEIDQMLDDDEDKEIIGAIFDFVKGGLRSQSE